MVVPVLIISCHVSLKPNIGPEIAQIIMTATARKKVPGLPAERALHLANRENHDWDLVGLIVFSFSQRSNELLAQVTKNDIANLLNRLTAVEYKLKDLTNLSERRARQQPLISRKVTNS
jgi:hypothetical protein